MITSDVASVVYDCDGVTTSFPITIEHSAEDDIQVAIVSEDDGSQTILTKDTDWTYTKDGDAISADLGQAYDSSYQLVISLDIAGTQEVEFLQGDPMAPNVLNDALDKLTLLINQAAAQAARTLYAPAGEVDKDFMFPTVAARRGKLLKFSDDENALPVASEIITHDVSSFIGELLLKTTAAAANEYLAGPKYLTAKRKVQDEKRTGQFSTDGHWYTVAVKGQNGSHVSSLTTLNVILKQSAVSLSVALDDRGAVSSYTMNKASIKFLNMVNGNRSDGFIQRARIGCSNVAAGRGAVLQLFIKDAPAYSPTLQLMGNVEIGDEAGWELLDNAILADTPTLPSGDQADAYTYGFPDSLEGTYIDNFTTGWHTIGVLPEGTNYAMAKATFNVCYGQSELEFTVCTDTRGDLGEDPHSIKIDLLNWGYSSNIVVMSARLVYSKAHAGAGAKVQVYIVDTSETDYYLATKISGIHGTPSFSWELTAPVLSNVPTTPNGDAGAFIEAGAEVEIPYTATNKFTASKIVDDDHLHVAVLFDGTPKKEGSDIEIDNASSLYVRDQNNNASLDFSGATFSQIQYSGNEVRFYVEKQNIAQYLSSGVGFSGYVTGNKPIVRII